MPYEDVSIAYGSMGFEGVRRNFEEMQHFSDRMQDWGNKVDDAFKRAAASFSDWSNKLSTVMGKAGESSAGFSEKHKVAMGNATETFVAAVLKAEGFGESHKAAMDKASSATKSWFEKHRDWFNKAAEFTGIFIGEIIKVGAALTGMALIGAGTAALTIGEFGKSVLSLTEKHRNLDISLFASVKSWDAVATATRFADEYAMKYALDSEMVYSVVTKLAHIPSMRPVIIEGDVEMLERFMNVVQALAILRPEYGMEGAERVLQRALATGRWTGLKYMGVPIEEISAQAGLSEAQMKKYPKRAMAAIEEWAVPAVGGLETFRMSAESVEKQIKEIGGIYRDWKREIGETGVYDKVVGYLVKLKDAFSGFMKGEGMAAVGKQIGGFLSGVTDVIAGILTKGIEWKGISNIGDLFNAIIQVAENARNEVVRIWGAIKDPLTSVLSAAFAFAAKATVAVAFDVFLPVGAAIAEAIYTGLVKQMREHPISAAIMAGLGGAMLGLPLAGPTGGLSIPIGAAVGMGSMFAGLVAGVGKGEDFKPRIQKAIDEFVAAMEKIISTVTVSVKRSGAAIEKSLHDLPLTLSEQFTKLESWAKMAHKVAAKPPSYLAELPFEAEERLARERRPIREKWMAGEMPTEEYRKYTTQWEKQDVVRLQLQRFWEDYETQLKKIVAPGPEGIPTAAPELQAKVYQKLFETSMELGRTLEAETYMQKSLSAMEEAIREQRDQQKTSNNYLKDIDDQAKDINKKMPGGGAGTEAKPEIATPTVPTPTAPMPTIPPGAVPIGPELKLPAGVLPGSIAARKSEWEFAYKKSEPDIQRELREDAERREKLKGSLVEKVFPALQKGALPGGGAGFEERVETIKKVWESVVKNVENLWDWWSTKAVPKFAEVTGAQLPQGLIDYMTRQGKPIAPTPTLPTAVEPTPTLTQPTPTIPITPYPPHELPPSMMAWGMPVYERPTPKELSAITEEELPPSLRGIPSPKITWKPEEMVTGPAPFYTAGGPESMMEKYREMRGGKEWFSIMGEEVKKPEFAKKAQEAMTGGFAGLADLSKVGTEAAGGLKELVSGIKETVDYMKSLKDKGGENGPSGSSSSIAPSNYEDELSIQVSGK